MPPGTMLEYEITRVEDGVARTVRDHVVTEFTLTICVNGRHLSVLTCTPDDLEALVYGHLLTHGLIRRRQDLKGLSIREGRAEAVTASLLRVLTERKFSKEVLVPASEILDAMEAFSGDSSLFAATGAAHSCAICRCGGGRITAEDIGRHNAFDKALGRALLEDWEIPHTFLLTSGRVPGLTVVKALRAGLPILVSRSAPTADAVELARRGNMTLCGFARGKRINIYSAPQRVLITEKAT